MYYVPDEVYPNAHTTLILEQPGPDEERLGLPAVGKASELLSAQFLPQAGLSRGAGLNISHVLRCRTLMDVRKVSATDRGHAIEHCRLYHGHQLPDTPYIILNGQLALDYATTTKHNLFDWRGHVLPLDRRRLHTHAQHSVFVTASTDETRRDPALRWVSFGDWSRIGALRNTIRGVPRPSWTKCTHVGAETIEFFTRARQPEARYFTIDTEFEPRSQTLTICGVGLTSVAGMLPRQHHNLDVQSLREGHADRSHREELHQSTDVLSIDWQTVTKETQDYISEHLRDCVRRIPTVFHNAMADIPVLEKACGITYEDYKAIDDTMLAHAILWCELPHTLEFLASIYGKYGKFKHLQREDELLYNYGDVVDTQSVWEGLVQGFKADTQAERVYREQSLRLLPILLKARKEGIRVNKQRVIEVFNEYFELTKRLQQYAQLAVGYPINLNSGEQLKHYLYTIRRFPVQIDKGTKRPTTNDDAINRIRQSLGAFDTSRELTFNTDTERSYSVVTRVAEGADPILEARALWASTWHTVNNYIVGLCDGVYQEYNKAKRKKAREQYWKEGITGENIVTRIYPNFAIHAQKTGRWSTTDPPLAQLPSNLRDIICPDPDEVCVTWDWSAIEPRVLQALTGSTLLKKTFDEGFDLHTWTVCYMFGYEFPPDLVDPHKAASCEAWRVRYSWKGKDDPRRVFAKQGRYEMWYGGTGSNAAQAAASFGLNAKDLKLALVKLATSDPAYYAWKVKTEAEVKRTALIRTFMGRPRRFLSSGDQRRREGLDQPMQGAVSDIFNTTAVLLQEQFPYLRWGWGMHDSQKWYIKRTLFNRERFEAIKSVVERTHQINGQVTRFPGDFEIILPPEGGNLKLTPSEYFNRVAHV